MSYITDFHNTSLILSYAITDFSKLKTYQSVSSDFTDIISYNFYGLWNTIFDLDNLEKAARLGCMDYIIHNANSDWSQIKPFSVLCISLKNNHVDFFKKICDIYGVEEEIILFIACRYGYLEIVDEILEKGEIDGNICANPMEYGDNPNELLFPVIRKYLDVPPCKDDPDDERIYDYDDKYLLEVFKTSDTGLLHIASMSGNLELVRYLVEDVGVDITSLAGHQECDIGAAQFALLDGEHFHIFQYLHSKGAPMYYPNYGNKFTSLSAQIFYSMLAEESYYHSFPYNEYKRIYEKNRPDVIEFFDKEFEEERQPKYRNPWDFEREYSATIRLFLYGDPSIVMHYGLVKEYEEWLYNEFQKNINMDFEYVLRDMGHEHYYINQSINRL